MQYTELQQTNQAVIAYVPQRNNDSNRNMPGVSNKTGIVFFSLLNAVRLIKQTATVADRTRRAGRSHRDMCFAAKRTGNGEQLTDRMMKGRTDYAGFWSLLLLSSARPLVEFFSLIDFNQTLFNHATECQWKEWSNKFEKHHTTQNKSYGTIGNRTDSIE